MHKQKVISIKTRLLAVFLMLISLVFPITSASALPESVLRMFSLNNILGYDDADVDCNGNVLATGVDPGTRYVSNRNDHGHWDGSCNPVNETRSQWMLNQLEHVQKVAAENGLPWEALFAQAITESGAGQKEVCDFNPLGLKNFGSEPPKTCDKRKHAEFNNYEEAWQWYVDGIISIRNAKFKFPQDPYSFMEFIEYDGPVYAVSSTYVTNASKHVCGIQKWAEENGIPTSAVTYDNFFNAESSDESPQNILNSVVTVKNNSALCPQSSSIQYTGADITQSAISLAWPYRGGADGGEAGMCDPDGSGNLVKYEIPSPGGYTKNNCRNNPKPAYAEAIAKFSLGEPKDCGHFVAAVVLTSGVDPNFPKGGANNMKNYMSGATDIWQEVSTSNLQPGDVVWKEGHILIYVGSDGGEWGNVEQASQNDTVGVTSSRTLSSSEFRAFRVKSQVVTGKLTSGGMNLSEAQAFMKVYADLPKDQWAQYNINSGNSCNGGAISNCVSFVKYFLARYTTTPVASTGNGSEVVSTLTSKYDLIPGDHTPRPYAIFSTPSGTTMCGKVKCGHTGVVLGIDEERGKIIIGEAGCSASPSWTGAHEYELSKFASSNYTYAYTDNILKDINNE